jgi:sulfonate transport system ATP-binding protein
MQDSIAQICREQHLTTLLITHDVEEAARMADRVIVVKDGTNVYEADCAKGQDAATIGTVSEQVLDVILTPTTTTTVHS